MDRKSRNHMLPACAAVFLFMTTPVFAEVRTFEKEYTYQATEDDSRNSSRTIALREVKRLLLEEMGTFLESASEVKNFQLTKDQITILTAGSVKTEIVAEKWDGRTYWLRARIAADSGEVIKSIDALRQDRGKTKELEEVRRQSQELLRQNERLREELGAAKGENREIKKAAYEKNIKQLTALEWFEKVYSSNDPRDEIDGYSQAIHLNPQFTQAYNNRGVAYEKIGDHRAALRDFDQTLKLDPGAVAAYYNRGISYGGLGEPRRAILDYDRAIELDPKLAMAYYSRGLTHAKIAEHQHASGDFDRTIELDPKFRDAYLHRGAAYFRLNKYQQALTDFDRAIERDAKFAEAYTARGAAYAKLGKYEQSRNDFIMAARLGDPAAQNFLKSKGTGW